jgi:hypothetical protein
MQEPKNIYKKREQLFFIKNGLALIAQGRAV